MMKLSALILVPIVIAAAGCSPSTAPRMCTEQYVWGLLIGVTDSATDRVMAAGVTVVVKDGAFADSVTRSASYTGNFEFALAGERAGTYSVTARKAGYKDWTQNNVQVTSDGCHVKPVVLTAKLQP